MVRTKTYWIVILLVLSLVALSHSGNREFTSSDQFPLPEELKVQVVFWIDVYSRYHTNEHIIHDARDLSKIYEVVKFGEIPEGKIEVPQSKQQRNILKQRSKKYKSILLKLASSKTNLKKLSTEELKVFQLFGESTNRKLYRTAAYNIRTQKGQKNRFFKGLEISGKYNDHIKRIFRKHGLPEELSVLPHVESSFNYLAYSSAGAAGMWQITRRTGRRFLKINYEIDERLDPLLSTEAAAKLLKNKYKTLGEWPIAITAYNHGLSGMKRAKRKLGTTDIVTIIKKYRSRYFGFASRNFYCEFLAALHVAKNYQKYFGEIEFELPIEYQEFELPNYLKFSTAANYFETNTRILKEFNPALRKPILTGTKYIPQNYKIRLPLNLDPEVQFASIPKSELFVDQKVSKYYRVRRGDTLGRIAQRHRTSISALMALNNIRSAHKIHAGEVLRIPDKPSLASLAQKEASDSKKTEAPERTIAVVTKPKTKEQTTPTTIPEASVKETIVAGPKIQAPDVDYTTANDRKLIQPEISFVANTNPLEGIIAIEPEETLGHYADWLKIPTQRIRNWNELDFGEDIQQGTEIRIVFEKVLPSEFINARLEYHRGIEEDFFLHFRVIGTTTHKIKRGENIWYLCNYVYKLPFWLIKSYNSDVVFQKLKAGDLIVIPEVLASDNTSSVNELRKNQNLIPTSVTPK